MPKEPSTSEVIRDAIEARLLDLHTATVGRVQSYDPVRQVADIALVVRRPLKVHDGSTDHETLPVLPNVPVLWPRAGGFFLHMPLAIGDHVLVVFSENSIAMWRETNSETNPGDLRTHNLSHAVAIPGMASALQPLTDLPNVGMDGDEAVLGGGVYRFGSKLLSVPVALAPIVDAFIAAYGTHTHGTGVGPSTPPIVPFEQSTAATKLKAE